MDKLSLFTRYIKELSRFDPSMLTMSESEIVEFVNNYLNQRLTEWIDIKEDNNVVGFIIVSRDLKNRHPHSQYAICQTYVLPEYRRRGLAEKTAKEYFAKHKGVVSLDILNGNTIASGFWYKVFSDIGARYYELEEIRDDEAVNHLTLYGYEIK